MMLHLHHFRNRSDADGGRLMMLHPHRTPGTAPTRMADV